MSNFTSEQDQKKRAEWAKIEASIQTTSPKDYALEWGRLREEFYSENGPLEVPAPDLDRLSRLKNKFKGKRIFIMGNGPSLNKTPLEFLKDEYTFGVNRIYLMDDKISWKPSFYTANDWRVVPDIALEINGLTGSTFFFEESFRGILREGSDTYFYRHSAADPDFPSEKSFGHEATRGIRGAGSVVGTAVQLAAYMGFDPIYLIGCDLGYKVLDTVEQTGEDKFGNGVKLFLTSTEDDDPNHFDSRYFGKGQRWHDPNVKRMISGHEQCKAGMAAKGNKIFNATVGGELEVYPRVDFNSLFPVRSYQGKIRNDGASLDETELVSVLLENNKQPKVMLDVGAHRGTSAKFFQGDDWRIFCFEPDPKNREGLKKHSKTQPNIVKIDPRAVGPVAEKGKKFYGSKESSGISGMLAFRDTHEVIATVDVTTVAEVMKENQITQIDFLKIDVEGFDLGVLKGVPWTDIKPDIIECEYEDDKTKLLGHTWRDICEYLRARHYTVYVSEWHPIIRYGVPHDWHTIKKYPCELSDEKSWGNLLAFKKDPGEKAVIDAIEKVIRYRKTPISDKPTARTEKQDISDVSTPIKPSIKNSTSPANSEPSPNQKPSASNSTNSSSDSLEARNNSKSDSFNLRPLPQNRLRDNLRTKAPSLFRIGQLGLWSLRFAKRHYLLATASVITIGGLTLAPMVFKAVEPYALYSWGFATLLVITGSTLLLSSFINMMANRIAQREITARAALREDLLRTLRQEQNDKAAAINGSIEKSKQQTADSILSDIDDRFENYVTPKLSKQQEKLESKLSAHSQTLEGNIKQTDEKLKSLISAKSAHSQAQLLDERRYLLNKLQSLADRLEKVSEKNTNDLRSEYNELAKKLETEIHSEVSKSSDDIGRRFLAKEHALRDAINLLESKLSEKIEQSVQDEAAASAKALNNRLQEDDRNLREMIKGLEKQLESNISENSNELNARLNTEKEALEELVRNAKDELLKEVTSSQEETEAKINTSLGDLDGQISKEMQTLRNKMIVLGRNFDEQIEGSASDSEELKNLRKLVEDTQNRLDEESKRNSTSFMQAHEQLEERLTSKIDSSTTYSQSTRESVKKYWETLRDHLIETKSYNSDIEKEINSYKAMLLDLQQKFETTSERIAQNDSTHAEHKFDIDEKLKVLTEAQAKIEQLESDLAKTREAIDQKSEDDKATFQHFNRIFTKTHIERIQKEWIKPLNLTLRPASIAYLANRIITIESKLKGRLATTIEAAVLRTLVAMSVQGKTINVLEIGTLFGTGVAMIHDRVKTNFEKTHITIIDPLEGYYGSNALDIATGEKINNEVLLDNLATAKIPKKDYTLLEGFSTEDDIINAASKQAYDVLIIDGDHSLAGVKADFINYAPFVKRGGYIIVDDYGTPDWPDIQKYVDDELLPRNDLALVGSMWRTAVFRVVKKVKD